MKITKTVIPAAGLGTRFLPYTKVIPKEMLPILSKPAIQMIVEEGIASGITDFALIISDEKQAIKQYFSPCPILDKELTALKKEHLIDSIRTVIHTAHFTYISQHQPLGLGHAVLMAQKAIGNHYFGIFLPDEIMICPIPALQQLMHVATQYNSSVIAVQKVEPAKVSSYGIISIKEQYEDDVFEIMDLVEKPTPEQAPSNYAIIGRYILSPQIFHALETIQPGAGGELQLTDGIASMIRNGEKVIACTIKGIRHDIGTPPGWLKANIDCALSDPLISSVIQE